jgi:DNA-binding transcriptional LysR family regulator
MTTGVDQAVSISEGRHDFNFTIEAMVSGNNMVDYLVSHHDQYCLALPNQHLLADQPLDFTKLADEPFVIISLADAPLLHNQILGICRQRGYIPKISSHYNRADAILLSVGAGAGISILPRELVQVYHSENVTCIPIPGDDCVLTSVITWKKNMTNTAAVKFLKVIQELFSKGTDSLGV